MEPFVNVENLDDLRKVFIDILCKKINDASSSALDSSAYQIPIRTSDKNGRLHTAATSLSLFIADFLIFIFMKNQDERKAISLALPGSLGEYFRTQEIFHGDENKAAAYTDRLIALHRFYMPYASKLGTALRNGNASGMGALFSAMLDDALKSFHYTDTPPTGRLSSLHDIYASLEETTLFLISLTKEYEKTRSMILVDVARTQSNPAELRLSLAEKKRRLFKDCGEGRITLDEFVKEMDKIKHLQNIKPE